MYIYKITNKANGKIYIGQTRQTLAARFNRHITRALNEKEYNYALCNAIRKYGAESFECELVEEVTADTINEREVHWINHYNSIAPNGYNMTSGGEGTSGYNHTVEDKKRMSNLKNGMFKGENNPFYGKKHTKEQIEKWRKDRTGRKLSEDWIRNISKTRKRKPIINLDTGEVFESARHACRYYGKDPNSGTAGNIAKVCLKRKGYNSCLGYRFEYYNPEVHDNTVPSLNIIKEGVTTIQ